MNRLLMAFHMYESVQDMPPPRPLPIALAHIAANTPAAAQEKWLLINRIYTSMLPVNKIRFHDELQWCRLAKRGKVEAKIS